jgi:hypothetical protein
MFGGARQPALPADVLERADCHCRAGAVPRAMFLLCSHCSGWPARPKSQERFCAFSRLISQLAGPPLHRPRAQSPRMFDAGEEPDCACPSREDNSRGRAMAIKKLSGEVKAFIVRSLACFDTPSTVAEAVERQFGETVTRQVVQCYNPHWRAGAKLSQQWRQLFEETRKAFVEETNKIGISHRNVRLRKLDQQVALAEERGDVATIARLLRLAEMEMRPYTKRGELHGTAGQPTEHHPPVSDRELAKAILLKLARAKAAAEAEAGQSSETRDRKSEIEDQGSQAGRRSGANGPKGGVAVSLNSAANHPDDHPDDWMAEFLASDY